MDLPETQVQIKCWNGPIVGSAKEMMKYYPKSKHTTGTTIKQQGIKE